MSESSRMILIVPLICGTCGLLLAGARQVTRDRIEEQIMAYVKGPAVKKVLASATNNPVEDRREAVINGAPVTVFVGRSGDEIRTLAYETMAEGFGGELGVMVGYDLEKDRLTGIGITSHRETPGVGARVTQDDFTGRFARKSVSTNFQVKKDGGEIDALTGATVSSRAVCDAVRRNVDLYPKIKAQVMRP